MADPKICYCGLPTWMCGYPKCVEGYQDQVLYAKIVYEIAWRALLRSLSENQRQRLQNRIEYKCESALGFNIGDIDLDIPRIETKWDKLLFP